MKQIFRFMAFFVASSLGIPLIAVYFGPVFRYVVLVMGVLVRG